MNGVQQYSTFFADRLHFAIDVDHVQEVVRPMPTTPVPLTGEVVDGLVNLRGQIITAIDLRSRLELPRRGEGEPSVSLIVRTSSGLISLRTDRLGDVLDSEGLWAHAELPTDSAGGLGKVAEGGARVLEPLPDTVKSAVRDIAQGIIRLDESLLLVLDPDLLLTADISLQPMEADH